MTLGSAAATGDFFAPMGSACMGSLQVEAVHWPPNDQFNYSSRALTQASYLLAKVKAAVPSASSKLSELQRKVEEPFDPYA